MSHRLAIVLGLVWRQLGYRDGTPEHLGVLGNDAIVERAGLDGELPPGRAQAEAG